MSLALRTSGGKTLTESRLSAFQRDTAIELLVERFIDDAHPSLRDFADDPESSLQKLDPPQTGCSRNLRG